MTVAFALGVARWAAIVGEDPEQSFGEAAGSEVIPAQLRRRLSRFPRQAARCILPLLNGEGAPDVIFASRFGDLAGTVRMLRDLAAEEILSPALFSMSVHNATPGVVSLCTPSPGDHTAIGAKGETLRMALIEAWSRLADGESQRCLVAFGEDRLPDPYGDLDEAAPAVFLAFEAIIGPSTEPGFALEPDRAGVCALVAALQAGTRRICLSHQRLAA